MIVLVILDILNNLLNLVQFVTINVVNVKDLLPTVLNVVVLELQFQVVHVQNIIMNFLIKPVLNVIIIVWNVPVTLMIVMNVGVLNPPITEFYPLLVLVWMDIMITELKSVKNVTINVLLVTPIQVVSLVLKVELIHQNVLVIPLLGLIPIGNVNLVDINVLNVLDLPITVPLVTETESMLQHVLAHLDISMIIILLNVLLVPQDVLLVLHVTLVLLVLLEDLVPQIVLVQKEPLNHVPKLVTPISIVMPVVIIQLVSLVLFNV